MISVEDCALLIKSCKTLRGARHAHSQVVLSFGNEHRHGLYLSNLLIHTYGNCPGGLDEARNLFHAMPNRNSTSWNKLLLACIHCRSCDEASRVFHTMPLFDVVSSTALVAAFSKNGDLESAKRIFDGIKFPNLISWNTILAAYNDHGHAHIVKEMFDGIPERGVVSWTVLLSAYAQNGGISDAKPSFDLMPQWNVVSWNAMLSAYIRFGWIQSGKSFFDSMPERNLVSWTSIVTAFAQAGRLQETEALFCAMPLYDVVTCAVVLDGFFRIRGGVDADADEFFRSLPVRSLVIWNTMIAGYSAAAGKISKCRKLFDLMPMRDIVSWTAILGASAQSRNLEDSKRIFAAMPCQDAMSWATMLGAFALSGDLQDAVGFFGCIPLRSVVAWTCLVGAYARIGEFRGALRIFREMNLDGIRANEVSFCCVLLGCSHGGLIFDGLCCFRSMSSDHGLNPLKEHYGCVIDLLCRSGHLQSAEELIHSMPFVPDEVEWTSLLGGCRLHKDSRRGARAAGSAVELRAECGSIYSLFANLCSEEEDHLPSVNLISRDRKHVVR